MGSPIDEGYFWISYEDFGKFVNYGYQAYLPPANTTDQLPFDVDLTIFPGVDQAKPFPIRPVKFPNGYTAYDLRSLHSNEPFKFMVKASREAYLYLLTASESDSLVRRVSLKSEPEPVIYRRISTTQIGYLEYPEKKFLTLGGPAGMEYCLFLFSEQPISEEAIKKYAFLLQPQKSPSPGRISTALRDAVAGQSITYKPMKMGFFSYDKGSLVIPLLLTIDHKP